MAKFDSIRPTWISWIAIGVLASVAGCGGGSTSSALSGANLTGPLIESVDFVDVDGNGVDRDDVVIVTFGDPVRLTSNFVTAFEFASRNDTFGDNARQGQTAPGSSRIEITLGTSPGFDVGDSELNIRSGGSINITDLSGDTARPGKVNRTVRDFTSVAPTLVRAIYVDSDVSGGVNVGDMIVAEFDKPINIASGATVANNFVLAITGDGFGTSPTLTAFDASSANRSVVVTLGDSPTLTVSGTYDTTVTTAGSPSNLAVAPAGSIGITDTLSSGANDITADTSVDLGASSSYRYRNGAEASLFPGTADSSTADVGAAALQQPAGVHHYSGNVAIGSNTFAIDALFVADSANNRVLIFDPKPTGNHADASVVLGQPDMYSNLANQSSAEGAAPTAAMMSGPEDVHYHATTNQLFVSDTGNNRVLVFDGVFSGSTGALTLVDGTAADVVIGQEDFVSSDANQGLSTPSSRTLSSPGGLHAMGGQLAVADTGNNRVLVWSSIPSTDNAAASVVLGQTSFIGALANQGGSAAAGTLSAPADVFIDPALIILNTTGAVIVADTGNNRVLVYSGSPSTGMSASVALGQGALTGSSAATTATGLDSPTGVTALDGGTGGSATGRIWVADRDNHRVMVYTFDPSNASQPATGDSGAQIGQASATAGSENRGSATATPAANSFAYPARLSVTESDESNLLVADRHNHRVVDFTTPPTADTSAAIVHGQEGSTLSYANGHRMNHPISIVRTAGKLIVADSLNHRVLLYNSTPTNGDPTPDVVIGQDNLNQTLADQGAAAPSAATLDDVRGVATDGTRLVIADTGNNRVLIHSTIPTSDGASASVVLGQADFVASLPNTGGISAARMDSPTDVEVSGTKLLVCDRDNHRVLVFNDFTSAASGATADVVIGQDDFIGNSPNHGDVASAATLHTPVAALVVGGVLYVVDQGNNRILGFNGIPTSNGVSADFVLGQATLFSTVADVGVNALSAPTGVASDGTALILLDGGNHRALLYSSLPKATNFAASCVLGQSSFSGSQSNRGGGTPSASSLSNPADAFFDGVDLWVSDEDNSRLVRFR